MIRRLRLINWRAYDELDLRLAPGTTFVVAPNGIGKTSLVEAAAWALFGDNAPTANRPVRAGADHAVASVEIELPDQRILSVERTHPSKAPRKAPEPVVHVDGEPLAPGSLDDLLRDVYGADPAFLARVAMPRPHTQPAVLDGQGLRDHLCRLFGVENLISAGAEVDARLRENDKRIKAAKQGSSVDRSRLEALDIAAAASAEAAETAAAAHARARAAVESANARARAIGARRDWETRELERLAQLDSLVLEAAELIDAPVTSDDLQHVLAAALGDAQAQSTAASRALGVNEGRARAIELTRHELDTAHGDCPVCRRPLDDQTASAARTAHDRDWEALDEERQALSAREAELASKAEALRRVSGAAAALPAQAPKPVVPPAETAEAASEVDVEAPQQSEAAALDALVAATAARDNARVALELARNDESAHKTLVGLFATDAVLRAARTTIDETVRIFVDGTVGPIAAEIRPRWAAVFPGRGDVQVDGGGALSRPVNGNDLAFESFSGGERTVALVLLRLLVVQMTTKATFCWFDEPLEHLDPDARRQVASLLAGAGNSLPLKQVLLTTYEQPLAERLAADSPGRINFVAVRAATAGAGPTP